MARTLAVFAVLLTIGRALSQSGTDGSVIKDGDRIVFIGDSITGQGAKGGKGAWISLIGAGVGLVRPEAKPTLIGLGGSGSTVGAWLGFEKRSRVGPLALDVKETDVGETLDAGAEIVVVMLGMNDVLAPSLRDEAASFDGWIARYGELVEAIRARSHPRVIAVATVTPCTEDPGSPKNRVLVELNKRLVTLAKEKNFRVLPTNEAAYEIQEKGRAWQPFFAITGDLVHPNRAGHLAIAVGMLRGLGEETAAARLLEKHVEAYSAPAGKLPVLSYTMTRVTGSPDDAAHRFIVKYRWTTAAVPSTSSKPPTVKPSVPAGWTVKPESLVGAEGQFEYVGPLDHAQNTLTLRATSGSDTREQLIQIPAGWRIAVGRGEGKGWAQNTHYDPAKDPQPQDEKMAKGEGFAAPAIFPVGEPSPWTVQVAGNDYTGRNGAGSVDFAAATFFSYNQMAYGARWIYSERERPVNLNLSSQTFAGTFSLGVWVNGQPAFAGKMKKETVPATLRQGWNLLFFRSSFIQWQWQFSIDVVGQPGDDLGDLRYATKPPTDHGK